MAKSTVAVRFTGDVADLKKATGEAERELEGFGSRAGPKLKTAMAGAGVAAGAVLASGFMEALDREASSARMGAALGLSEEDAKALGKTAGDIYSQGWGESFDAVTGAIETVQSNLDEFIKPDQLEPLTVKAIALADVFRLDVGEAVRAVGFMLRNGMAKDAEEAFDLITVGLQSLPTEMRGEALEAISEYGGAFSALGFEGDEAIRLILTAAQDTSVGVDKVGDAIKEFLIRSTDGSTASREALQWLKLDADEVATAIAGGGPAAEEAFGKVVEALLTVEDPAYRAQIAVALFGTPIEDLSINKLPDFLKALQDAEEGMGDVEGAADDLTEAMDTNSAKIDAFKRQWETKLVNFIAEDVIPALEDLDENWGLTMELVGFYTEKAADRAVDALGRIRDGFSGPIDGALDLLELLNQLGGGKVVNAAADALGVDKSDIQFLPPTEWNYNTNTPTSPREREYGSGPVRQRALGGLVGPGEAFLVGEDGPELLVNNTFGRITPGVGGGANVVINVNGGDHDAGSIASVLAWQLGGR